MEISYAIFPEARSFGVEVELRKSITQQRIKNAIAVADSLREVRVSTWKKTTANSWWEVKTDSTCGDAPKDGGGWEIASPILNGHEQLAVLGNVIKQVQDAGGSINNNCGFHVHAGAQNFKFLSHVMIAAAWMRIEDWFMEMLPESRRNNLYCRNLKSKVISEKYIREIKAEDLYFYIENFCMGRNENRRVSLNFMNYVQSHYSKESAIELRSPEGTVSSNDVKNWVRFFLRFVSYNFNKKIDKECMLNVSTTESLSEFFQVVGFSADAEKFCILSPGLRKCKIWMLNRFIKYSKIPAVKNQAESILDSVLNLKK